MLIQVTYMDIIDGVKGSCRVCPIALAVARKLNKRYTCTVTSVVEIKQGLKTLVHVLMPDSARKFITDYDEGRKVEPFEFELDIPTQYLRN